MAGTGLASTKFSNKYFFIPDAFLDYANSARRVEGANDAQSGRLQAEFAVALPFAQDANDGGEIALLAMQLQRNEQC